MQKDTLKKGLEEYRHPSLAWLYRMYAVLRGMFTADLPELASFEAPDIKAPIFRVVAWIRNPDGVKILDSIESEDPADVDFLIADMASKWSGATLTLMGPGVALRLNRRARRAALARVRRSFRREDRAKAGYWKLKLRLRRQAHDINRRESLSRKATLRASSIVFAEEVWGQEIPEHLRDVLRSHDRGTLHYMETASQVRRAMKS